MSIKKAISFGKETYKKWSDHNAPRLGASVAFYSILSFAPLLILVTAAIGLIFGDKNAHGALVNEARQVIGEHGADTVDSLLKNAQKPASGIFASVVAFITLLFGASGVFAELQDALNIMWDAPKQNVSGVFALLKQRLFSFGMVLSIAFLLLVSLLLSAGLAYLGHSFGELVPLPPFVLQIVNFVVSIAVVTVLFALMFKYVPAVPVSWRDVAVGSIGTALLFAIGKFLLGIYLGRASVGSTYGAAGSLVAVVVWIYYSAQILFFGAQFTRVYADRYRGQPSEQTAARAELETAPASAFMAAAAAAPYSSRPPVPVEISYAPRPTFRPKTRGSPAALQEALKAGSTISRRPAKPRLLTAAAIGFLIGRVTGTFGKKRTPSV